MKRIALVAAVVVLASCAQRDDAVVDTGTAMAPAPATMDTGMQMMDTSMMRDTTMMAPPPANP